MNWLAHVYLSEPDVESRLGNVLADFVKRNSRRLLSAGVLRGIACHQAIDSFTDHHPLVERSKQRIAAPHARFSGILVDVFYDHFLACSWSDYSTQTLQQFTALVYESFQNYPGPMPADFSEVVSRMAADDWLGSYGSIDGVVFSLERISARLARRLHRPFALQEAVASLTDNYRPLGRDFADFLPEVVRHGNRWCRLHARR